MTRSRFVDEGPPVEILHWPATAATPDETKSLSLVELDLEAVLDIADEVTRGAALAFLVKHLPGKHDQGSHGHGGATGSAALAAAPLGLVDHKVDAIGRVKSRPGPGMTPEEGRALSSYREAGFVKVNRGLRKSGGEVPSGPAGVTVERIDSAMSRSALTEDISVERGISNGPSAFGEHWQSDMTGMRFVDHAFVSTTTDHSIAGEFADRIPGVSDGALSRVSVPAGTSAIKLSDKGPFQEAELLLDRGLTFEVVSDTGPGAGRQIELAVRR